MGCNVENASYGLTNYAEQVAICSAISENERDFKAIAIITKSGAYAVAHVVKFLMSLILI